MVASPLAPKTRRVKLIHYQHERFVMHSSSMRTRAIALGLALALAAASALPDSAFAAQGRPDEGPDILPLALITAGAIGAAAFVGLVLYVVRLRIGYSPHRPPPREGGEPDEH